MNLVDLTGKHFGRLVVLERAPNRTTTGGRSYVCWKVLCICGAVFITAGNALTQGHTLSCGCLSRERAKERGKNLTLKHGQDRKGHPTAEYVAWVSMKSRCFNPLARGYERYGGAGVTVCERWRNDFTAFYNDMGKKPAADYSLDRIDPFGDYEPSNCRWADKTTQSRNTRKRFLKEMSSDDV